MDGLWLELGPLRLLNKGSRVDINPFSWHNIANLLFIDQPVGTGFAYTKSKKNGYARNDEMVNEQFYQFLQSFFKLYPRYINMNDSYSRGEKKKEYASTRSLFISGESHAGHYISTMSLYILNMNKDIVDNHNNRGIDGLYYISLEGIALGNPWIDPYSQYDTSDFAHGLGLISVGQKNRMKELEKTCQRSLLNGNMNTPVCYSLLDKIIETSTVSGNHKVLMYDSRQYVRDTSVFPPGHEDVEKYLNRADVKAAIHTTACPHAFMECSNPPYYALIHQDGKGIAMIIMMMMMMMMIMIIDDDDDGDDDNDYC
jgi:hypothetical protein